MNGIYRHRSAKVPEAGDSAKKKTLKELRTEYQQFINSIPQLLNWVEENIIGGRITFSLNEIEKVQSYYEANFLKEGMDLEHLKKCFFAYTGEAFIKYNGGNWALSTLKNDEAYGTPIIINWGPMDYLGPNTGSYPWTRVSPFVWTEVIRKRGKMERRLKQMIEADINRFKTKRT